MARLKGKFQTDEARRDYQRRYYQLHIEKAKEYQRLYNLSHKKKGKGKGKRNFVCPRKAYQVSYSISDVQHTPAEKLPELIENFNKDERIFTA